MIWLIYLWCMIVHDRCVTLLPAYWHLNIRFCGNLWSGCFVRVCSHHILSLCIMIMHSKTFTSLIFFEKLTKPIQIQVNKFIEKWNSGWKYASISIWPYIWHIWHYIWEHLAIDCLCFGFRPMKKGSLTLTPQVWIQTFFINLNLLY